jgi:hypothetical protein
MVLTTLMQPTLHRAENALIPLSEEEVKTLSDI